jgi:hypothetical protein
VVQDGLTSHTFREVDMADVEFDHRGQPYSKTTGRPLLTRQRADAEIAKLRGRRK